MTLHAWAPRVQSVARHRKDQTNSIRPGPRTIIRPSTNPSAHVLEVVLHQPSLLHALKGEAGALIRISLAVEPESRPKRESRQGPLFHKRGVAPGHVSPPPMSDGMAMSRWLCGFCWLWSRDSAVGHPRGGIKGETQRGGVVVGVVDGLQVSSLVDEAHWGMSGLLFGVHRPGAVVNGMRRLTSTGVLDPLLVFRSGKPVRPCSA